MSKLLQKVFLCLIISLFACPLVSLISILFTEQQSAKWAIHTLLFEYTANTILLMIGVGVISFVFGVISSWFVTFFSFPGCKFFEVFLFLPISIPGYIVSFVYTNVLEYSGPIQSLLREIFHLQKNDYWFPEIRSLGGGILILGFTLFSYVYILARSSFTSLNNSVIVASTLGQSPFKIFTSIALPAARPAITAGILLIFMEVIADFGTSQILAINTLTTGVYRTWFLLHDRYSATILSIIELSIIMLFVIAERISNNRQKLYSSIIINSDYQRRWNVNNKILLISIYLVCTLPILIGFIFPIIPLIYWTVQRINVFVSDLKFYIAIINSISIALVAGSMLVITSLVIGYAARYSKITYYVARFISIGYAIPSAIVAIAILTFLGKLSSFISRYTMEITLIGTTGALLYSYMFRFFAISFKTIEAGLRKIPNEIDWASYTMGYSSTATCINIHIPLIKRSVLFSFLLAFIDIIQELTATLIIRPFNFETLTTRMYGLICDERYMDAAPLSIVIVLISLISVTVLLKLSNTDK
ncbi:iron ABC transporter permease [Candidatus Mesenet endosymbiont of Agriotes lineatus]|uniref:ABC transporter permease n=1 Tax=Candidatus Mesenet endosymbiont of Agriotes lineatus TaxID=3077948 RepID=UPI0030D1B565